MVILIITNIKHFRLQTSNVSTDSNIVYRKNTQMGLNQQLFDMGMLERDTFDVDIVKEYIKSIKREFDFIMIAEFFEESLILLAHYLCWPLEFMVGVSHNVRKSDKKVSNK